LGGLRRVADRRGYDALPDAREATISLVIFCAVYAFIFLFGTLYIYRLIRKGPFSELIDTPRIAVPNRPLSLADESPMHEHSHGAGE
jgi:cytochrome d ubiquinol oxidase subunit I